MFPAHPYRIAAFLSLLVVAGITSCGTKETKTVYRDPPKEAPEDSSVNQPEGPVTESVPEDPTAGPGDDLPPPSGGDDPPPRNPEGDFSGSIDVDAEGRCSVRPGDDVDTVSCTIGTHIASGLPQVTLAFPAFELTQPPVCVFQTSEPGFTAHVVDAQVAAVSVAIEKSSCDDDVKPQPDPCRPCLPCPPPPCWSCPPPFPPPCGNPCGDFGGGFGYQEQSIEEWGQGLQQAPMTGGTDPLPGPAPGTNTLGGTIFFQCKISG